MELSALGRRIIGVLLEKEATTPAQYPLSVNSLASGCSQKSNRDPVMNVLDAEVERELRRLQAESWVTNVAQPGSRILKWKHRAEEKLELQGRPLAVLAELLLRGEQQPGELRTRASRMIPISDLDSLETAIHSLESKELVSRLAPRPGERSGRFDHRLYAADEQESGPVSEASVSPTDASPDGESNARDASIPSPPLRATTQNAREEDALSERLKSLEQRVAELESDLARRVTRIEDELGLAES